MALTILYVDHEINNLNSFKATFRRDADVFVARSVDEGFDILNEQKVDVVFADHQMPGLSGLEFLKQVYKVHPETVRVLLTGNAYTDEFRAATEKGFLHNYVNKPWDEEHLRELITSHFN
jgi:response regulator RpfG family c-di-GMP phosphodiesterase